jgi:hypothetical protein
MQADSKNGSMGSKKLIFANFLVIGFAYIFIACSSSHPMITFEISKWKESEEVWDWDTRCGMANYLIRQRAIVGKKRTDILAELGDSRIKGYEGSSNLYYGIREEYGSWIDPVYVENLVIRFDGKDIATEAYIQVLREGVESRKDESHLYNAPNSSLQRTAQTTRRR